MIFKFRLRVLALAVLNVSACFPSDPTLVENAQVMPSQNVERLPESLRTADNRFTGVVVFGDAGYTGAVGNAPYPSVFVNGQPVGKCQKRRAYLIPLPAGTHVVEARSENKVPHTVTLAEGDVAYFRCNYMRIGGILLPPAVLDTSDAAEAFKVVNN